MVFTSECPRRIGRSKARRLTGSVHNRATFARIKLVIKKLAQRTILCAVVFAGALDDALPLCNRAFDRRARLGRCRRLAPKLRLVIVGCDWQRELAHTFSPKNAHSAPSTAITTKNRATLPLITSTQASSQAGNKHSSSRD